MRNFTYTLTSPEGLHARPAGILVKCAQTCASEVTIESGGRKADGKRLFSVMGLGAKQNSPIRFFVTGEEEEADTKRLQNFCEKNL